MGGYCSSFKRKGFTFNAKVEDVSGLWEKGPVNFLLKEIGAKKEELFVRFTQRTDCKGLLLVLQHFQVVELRELPFLE